MPEKLVFGAAVLLATLGFLGAGSVLIDVFLTR